MPSVKGFYQMLENWLLERDLSVLLKLPLDESQDPNAWSRGRR
jgi:hypothetical protein